MTSLAAMLAQANLPKPYPTDELGTSKTDQVLYALKKFHGKATTRQISDETDISTNAVWGLMKYLVKTERVRRVSNHWILASDWPPHILKAANLLKKHGFEVIPPASKVILEAA